MQWEYEEHCYRLKKKKVRHGGKCLKVLRGYMEEDLCEFEARLVYVVISRTTRITWTDPRAVQ